MQRHRQHWAQEQKTTHTRQKTKKMSKMDPTKNWARTHSYYSGKGLVGDRGKNLLKTTKIVV
jgi:hypothetical protein